MHGVSKILLTNEKFRSPFIKFSSILQRIVVMFKNTNYYVVNIIVVIGFQINIFEPLEIVRSTNI